MGFRCEHGILACSSDSSISLPVGAQDESGEPLFVIMEKAMHGLRSAGMSWYRRLAELLELERLTACVTEKTVFAGRCKKGVAGTEEENQLIVLCIDDLLVVWDDGRAQLLVDELSKKLGLKVTGMSFCILEERKVRQPQIYSSSMIEIEKKIGSRCRPKRRQRFAQHWES